MITAAWLTTAILLLPPTENGGARLELVLSASTIQAGADLQVSLETTNDSQEPILVRPHGEYLASEISFVVVSCAGSEVTDGAILQSGEREWTNLHPGESLTTTYPFPVSDLLSLIVPGPYSLVARIRLGDGQLLVSAPVAFTVEPLPRHVIAEIIETLGVCMGSTQPCSPEILVQVARVRLPEIRALLTRATPGQVAADPLLAAAIAANPSPEGVALLNRAAGMAPDNHARRQVEFLTEKAQRSLALEAFTATSCDQAFPR